MFLPLSLYFSLSPLSLPLSLSLSLSLSRPRAFILPLVMYLWSDLGSVEDGFVEHGLMMIKCDHG